MIYPIFEAGFIGNTFANRTGKGTHAAIRVYERHRDNYAHVLRADRRPLRIKTSASQTLTADSHSS